ncbi:MAG: exodeoxyribonuclease VII large subunit [Bacillales bacterium]|nr:exodeoxyribonuclease VII large subunit [Bacillales bacterium]
MDENNDFLSVSSLTLFIKSMFESEPFLMNVTVEGEISNFKKNSSEHMYFTLKDESSQISCVMFKSFAQLVNFMPKDGAKVYVKGSVQIYPKSGVYQIYVHSMREQGIGDLYQKYEELKNKLSAKGYFDSERKKKLPSFPKNIALLTSKTGSVIEDLKSIILKRSQFSDMTLYPTKVQGEDAKYSIVENIKKANQNPDIDVIILARGGGSIEDLWPFNEEIVADAIYNSIKPIISAVGHETDFTISDYTADLRAATPSDAALIVVKNSLDLKNELDSLSLRLNLSYKKEVNDRKIIIDKVFSSPVFKTPERILLDYKQKLLSFSEKIDLLSPQNVLNNHKDKINSLSKDLDKSYVMLINSYISRYKVLNEKISLLNPLSVLDKGYSITYKDGIILKSTKELSVDDIIETKLKNGKVFSKIIDIKE